MAYGVYLAPSPAFAWGACGLKVEEEPGDAAPLIALGIGVKALQVGPRKCCIQVTHWRFQEQTREEPGGLKLLSP